MLEEFKEDLGQGIGVKLDIEGCIVFVRHGVDDHSGEEYFIDVLKLTPKQTAKFDEWRFNLQGGDNGQDSEG